MSTFIVQFYKILDDSTGHRHDVCQKEVKLEADDISSALAKAEPIFCDSRSIPDWTLHADYIKAGPSAVVRRDPFLISEE